jgi:uncharacterized protein YceK
MRTPNTFQATMRASIFLIIAALAGICFLTGCSTMVARGSNPKPESYYPATELDILAIGQGGGYWVKGDGGNTSSSMWGIVAVPMLIVDIPISLVSDTLWLPFDANRFYNEKGREANIFVMATGVETTDAPDVILLDTSDLQHDKGAAESKDLPWATFRCVSSGQEVKVKVHGSFNCPGSVNRYTLLGLSREKVWVEKEKIKSDHRR